MTDLGQHRTKRSTIFIFYNLFFFQICHCRLIYVDFSICRLNIMLTSRSVDLYTYKRETIRTVYIRLKLNCLYAHINRCTPINQITAYPT